jgi:hypothetical protein
MRAVRLAVTVSAISIGAAGILGEQAADAQASERTLTALEVAVSCGPPPSIDIPADAHRITGAQDTVARSLFDPRDTLVIDGGAKDGFALGQKYFIRRPVYNAADRRPQALLTLGWLTIVALNDTTALGSFDHFCGGVQRGDFVVPYAPPTLPPNAERDDAGGELDFSSLGRVLSGTEHHSTVGIGNLMLIDRGEDQGVQPGA